MTRKPSKPAKAAKKPTTKAKPKAAPKPKVSAKSAGKRPRSKAKLEKTAAAKKAPAAKLAKPAKAAAPKPAPAAVKGPAAKAAAKKKPAVVPLGVAKPGFGYKWSCFNCGAKFYDLGKPVPICPKCEADQRDRPPQTVESPPPQPAPKRPAMAPMSRFLDDDEVTPAPPDEEFGGVPEEAEEPETGEIDIESLEEPGGLQEGEFSEGGEEE